jgi:DNA-binding SARP family transcriptional activator
MKPFHLQLMGCAELRDGEGRTVALTTKKNLLTLAVLCFSEGLELSRIAIAEQVWPGKAEKATRDSLRTALSAIRKLLPKDSIEASIDNVKLKAGSLSCDACSLSIEQPYPGDFMPDFDEDWVIDRRLELRDRYVDELLKAAQEIWSQGLSDQALKVVESAAAIDPLREDAVHLRMQLLDAKGQHNVATRIADSFRVSSLRDLGVLPELRASAPVPSQDDHPLVSAAQWMLDRDPNQALDLLASTHPQWLTMGLPTGLDLHERTLASATVNSSSRMMVEAQRVYLLTLDGRGGPYLEEGRIQYERALAASENLVAARIAGALALAHLSRGDFKQALSFAERANVAVAKTNDRSRQLEFLLTLGIVQQHVGQFAKSRETYRECARKAEDHGSPQEIAQVGFIQSGFWIEVGKPERAAAHLETSRRIFESMGSHRMIPWAIYEESILYASIGDYHRARTLLEQIYENGLKTGGHSLIGSVEDQMAWIDCKLGELDTAVEAIARAAVYRRSVGSVPSILEATRIDPAKRVVRENLSRKEIELAFRKAQERKLS